MIRMQLDEAARIAGAEARGGAVAFRGVCMHSGRVEAGNLFLALPGNRVHGVEFAAEARARGAVAMLSDRLLDEDWPQLHHPRPVEALGRLASHWRRRLPVRVVGVTGSNGKTTVKNLLAALLGRDGPTHATGGNFNNELGLPLNLCRLAEDHRWAVLEMGAGRPGDIATLCGLARPEVGVITNASAAHLAGMGSVDQVVETKGELVEALPEHGVAVLNADDRAFPKWCRRAAGRRVVSFGTASDADVRVLPAGPGQLRLAWGQQHWQLPFRLQGEHNRMNAAAAAAACVALELELADLLPVLSRVDAEPGRLQPRRRKDGLLVVDDSYNANPASARMAVASLMQLEVAGRRHLVMGEMAELGPDSTTLHRSLGAHARQAGVDGLWCLGGRDAAAMRSGFGEGEGGVFDDCGTLVAALSQALQPQDAVLVKGSRCMGMERVVEALLEVESC